MERLSELKNNYGIRLVPVQWKTMLESGIEVDVLNNNLFDLSVIDLCEGEEKRSPNSFIFSVYYNVLGITWEPLNIVWYRISHLPNNISNKIWWTKNFVTYTHQIF